MSYVVGGALLLATLAIFIIFWVAFRDESGGPPRTEAPKDADG